MSDVSEIAFHLAPDDKMRIWHCPECGTKLFYSHHKLVRIAEEGGLDFIAPPIIIPCHKCGVRLAIQNII